MIIREKNILAFSRSIELIWKFKVNFKYLATGNWCKIRNISLEKDGLLFLQAGSMFIISFFSRSYKSKFIRHIDRKRIGIGRIYACKFLIRLNGIENFISSKRLEKIVCWPLHPQSCFQKISPRTKIQSKEKISLKLEDQVKKLRIFFNFKI